MQIEITQGIVEEEAYVERAGLIGHELVVVVVVRLVNRQVTFHPIDHRAPIGRRGKIIVGLEPVGQNARAVDHQIVMRVRILVKAVDKNIVSAAGRHAGHDRFVVGHGDRTGQHVLAGIVEIQVQIAQLIVEQQGYFDRARAAGDELIVIFAAGADAGRVDRQVGLHQVIDRPQISGVAEVVVAAGPFKTVGDNARAVDD